MSVIKDPDAYERFETIVLVHGVRTVGELAYQDFITKELPGNEFFGEDVKTNLVYYPTVSRADFRTPGRGTDPLTSGTLFRDLRLPPRTISKHPTLLCCRPTIPLDNTP